MMFKDDKISTKTPEQFVDECHYALKLLAAKKHLFKNNLYVIPEIVALSKKHVLKIFRSESLFMKYSDGDAYYIVSFISACFQAGIIIGAKWDEDVINLEYDTEMLMTEAGRRHEAYPLLTYELRMNKTQYKDFMFEIFCLWEDMFKKNKKYISCELGIIKFMEAVYLMGVDVILYSRGYR